jgi:hypothetical protein
MKRFVYQVQNDLRLIFRDPILYIMMFLPALFILFLRFGLPHIIASFPPVEPYSELLLGVFCLITAMFPAFIFSFVLLDEKDQDVIVVYRVLPLSPWEFLSIRLVFITVLCFLSVLMTVLFSSIAGWPFPRALLVSLPVCMIAPVMTLYISAFARNKIEGATWLKGLNFLMFLPVLSYFIKGSYEYLLGLLPVYWIFKLFDPGYSSIPFGWNYILANSYLLILLLTGIRAFRKRIFP